MTFQLQGRAHYPLRAFGGAWGNTDVDHAQDPWVAEETAACRAAWAAGRKLEASSLEDVVLVLIASAERLGAVGDHDSEVAALLRAWRAAPTPHLLPPIEGALTRAAMTARRDEDDSELAVALERLGGMSRRRGPSVWDRGHAWARAAGVLLGHQLPILWVVEAAVGEGDTLQAIIADCQRRPSRWPSEATAALARAYDAVSHYAALARTQAPTAALAPTQTVQAPTSAQTVQAPPPDRATVRAALLERFRPILTAAGIPAVKLELAVDDAGAGRGDVRHQARLARRRTRDWTDAAMLQHLAWEGLASLASDDLGNAEVCLRRCEAILATA